MTHTNCAEAFILYRSHHNAAVAARYKGVSNPRISEIIGKMWHDASGIERQRWKDYAEVCFPVAGDSEALK